IGSNPDRAKVSDGHDWRIGIIPIFSGNNTDFEHFSCNWSSDHDLLTERCSFEVEKLKTPRRLFLSSPGLLNGRLCLSEEVLCTQHFLFCDSVVLVEITGTIKICLGFYQGGLSLRESRISLQCRRHGKIGVRTLHRQHRLTGCHTVSQADTDTFNAPCHWQQ